MTLRLIGRKVRRPLRRKNKRITHVHFPNLLVFIFPFELLARSLPLSLLRKYCHSLTSLEALLFGQSGFLDADLGDLYFKELQTEYAFLKSKHNLNALDSSIWKFSKLRPPNFPTIRLAQIATLLHNNHNLWKELMEAANINYVRKIFDISASGYWSNHYVFGKEAANNHSKKLGENAIDSLIINALSPLLFAYSLYKGNELIKEKAIGFLEKMKVEKNSAISEWENVGIKPTNAFESQALIHLKSHYCNKRKCLNCSIGNNIMKNIIA